ncbi:MAG: SIMPL domain-containing protein [Bdellovibrionales bacterium]|nr:SIMPL domain-containing protein [Bdellovibrionales bacterium]
MNVKNLSLICTTLLGFGFLMMLGLKDFNRTERKISVRGLAEKVVDSDVAVWRISYTASGERMEAIQTSFLNAQREVEDFLKENGFSDDEISKTSNLQDRMTESYATGKGARFVASGYHIVTTGKVTQVEKIEQKVDRLLKKGIVLTGSQKNYYFTQLNKIKPQMLDEATQNASEAAHGFAKSMNVKVGALKSATQGVFTIESPMADGENRYGGYGERNNTIKKKVRVVTQVDFDVS